MPKGFPSNIAAVARPKLRMLDTAARLDDLRVPRFNRLEALVGDREGQHSIRVNDRWRLCFVWRDGAAHGVEMVDYHAWETVMTIRHDERLDLSDITTGERLPNVAPGEVLREEFMVPLGLSARALARDIGVPPNRVTEILNGERAVSAETAILLSRRFGTTPEFWMNLQTAHDLEVARRTMAA